MIGCYLADLIDAYDMAEYYQNADQKDQKLMMEVLVNLTFEKILKIEPYTPRSHEDLHVYMNADRPEVSPYPMVLFFGLIIGIYMGAILL